MLSQIQGVICVWVKQLVLAGKGCQDCSRTPPEGMAQPGSACPDPTLQQSGQWLSHHGHPGRVFGRLEPSRASLRGSWGRCYTEDLEGPGD